MSEEKSKKSKQLIIIIIFLNIFIVFQFIIAGILIIIPTFYFFNTGLLICLYFVIFCFYSIFLLSQSDFLGIKITFITLIIYCGLSLFGLIVFLLFPSFPHEINSLFYSFVNFFSHSPPLVYFIIIYLFQFLISLIFSIYLLINKKELKQTISIKK